VSQLDVIEVQQEIKEVDEKFIITEEIIPSDLKESEDEKEPDEDTEDQVDESDETDGEDVNDEILPPIDLSKYTRAEKSKGKYNSFYGIQQKTTEEIAEEEEPIKALVTGVDAFGVISVSFSPPEVSVPDNWARIFRQEERAKLSLAEQRVNLDFVSQVFRADYDQRSEESS